MPWRKIGVAREFRSSGAVLRACLETDPTRCSSDVFDRSQTPIKLEDLLAIYNPITIKFHSILILWS